MCNRAQVSVKRSPTLGTLVNIKTKCIKLIFVGKITLVPVAFLMVLSIYLMIISEIQSEIGHCSCDGAKFKAPAYFSHHAILLYDIVLKRFRLSMHILTIIYL